VYQNYLEGILDHIGPCTSSSLDAGAVDFDDMAVILVDLAWRIVLQGVLPTHRFMIRAALKKLQDAENPEKVRG